MKYVLVEGYDIRRLKKPLTRTAPAEMILNFQLPAFFFKEGEKDPIEAQAPVQSLQDQ